MSTHGIRAVLFDTFGSVTDWRTSLIDDCTAWAAARWVDTDWTGLIDAWRGAYVPSMNRVRSGELPWTILSDLQLVTLKELAPRHGLVGLDDAALDHINRGWERLKPWADAVPGLSRIKTRFTIAPLSNGNVSLLLNMAKHAALPWDMICGADLFHHYKPDPETYLGAARLLGLDPGQVVMAAAHNADLHAARALGLRTAFFARPTEYGPHQTKDLTAEADWDVIASDIEDLATRLGT